MLNFLFNCNIKTLGMVAGYADYFFFACSSGIFLIWQTVLSETAVLGLRQSRILCLGNDNNLKF